MASFSYFYKIRIDLSKSSSGEALLSKWHEEAQAALGAIDAVVYVIATFEGENAIEAHGTALATFGTLPMFNSGHIIIEEASSVLDYREWAAYLANRNS